MADHENSQFAMMDAIASRTTTSSVKVYIYIYIYIYNILNVLKNQLMMKLFLPYL